MSQAIQQCRLEYSELQELALRLSETAESVRNRAVKADINEACRAISDLASTRFAVEQLARKLIAINCKDKCQVWNDAVDIGAELFAALGKVARP
jgi:hypothetical protein